MPTLLRSIYAITFGLAIACKSGNVETKTEEKKPSRKTDTSTDSEKNENESFEKTNFKINGACKSDFACLENYSEDRSGIDKLCKSDELMAEVDSCDVNEYTTACIPADLRFIAKTQRYIVAWYKTTKCNEDYVKFKDKKSIGEHFDEERLKELSDLKSN